MQHLFVTSSLLLLFVFFGLMHSADAQVVVHSQQVGIRVERRIDETTRITNKETGKRVSYREYQELMKADPQAYRLEPVYDEYGKAVAYLMRPATGDEQGTNRTYGRDLTQQPKVGEPMPLTVMKGLDGKEYRSADLKGRVVILSFWMTLERPFWGPKQAETFADAIRPSQSATEPVVLGVMQASKASVEQYLTTATLPFVPIPDAYGFHNKFQISGIPSFIVIDKAGNVAAFIDGQDYTELKKALGRASR